MLEREYQSLLIKRIRILLPECFILKNDTDYIQGIPDLTILYKDKWAMLEVKASMNAPRRPNQAYYIQALGEMSFAAFICPENEEDVLYGLQRALLSPRRSARISQPQ